MKINHDEYTIYEKIKFEIYSKAREIALGLSQYDLPQNNYDCLDVEFLNNIGGKGTWKYRNHSIESHKLYLILESEIGCAPNNYWDVFSWAFNLDDFFDKGTKDLVDIVINEINIQIKKCREEETEREKAEAKRWIKQKEKDDLKQYERLKKKFENIKQ